MPSERDRDEGDEASQQERDEAETEAEQTAAAGAAAEPADGEPAPDAPRNRAERRAAAKAERRGIKPQAAGTVPAAAGAAGVSGRPRLPPKTIKGRSSADEVAPWARGLVDWMSRQRKVMVAGAAAVVLVAGGAVGWTLMREQKFSKAAALYHEATRVERAEVREGEPPPDPPNAPPRTGPTFPNATARSQAALRAFRQVTERYPNAPVAPLARLGEAHALYELGRYDEARRVYQSLLDANVAGLHGRVLEGLGFALEGANQLEAALRRYEELARVDEGAYRDEAAFHQARVLQRLNRTDRARDLLRGLLERLNRARPDDPMAAVALGSVHENARALLAEIDPGNPLARRQASPMGQIDPEMLRRLFESQSRQRAPGGGE